jgi:D-alanine transaminase
MQVLACLNGEIMPIDEARVPVTDRGFMFADSVYEVFRLYEGRRWLESAHMARLERSLHELAFPAIDLERLTWRLDRTTEASGVAPRAHAFPNPPVPPTELFVIRPYDDAPTAAKRAAGVAVVSHPDFRWGRCDIKTTNLLANVLACEAAHRAGCLEAVLFDASGLVTEATHSSLFWIRGGHLEGTPEGPEILPGTTRQHTVELARSLDIPFREARISLSELMAADEVILTGTTIEVLAVVRIDQTTIGDGCPGPLARRLQTAFTADVARWLAS